MLTWVFIVLCGAAIGWLASVIADAETVREVLAWIIAGIGGGVLGGLVLTPWLAGGPIVVSGFSLPNLLIAMLGTTVVPAIAMSRRRERQRPEKPARR